jgi:hypothetical protein
MRIAARHKTLEAQLAARDRHRDAALQDLVRSNRARNEGLAEDEAVQPRYASLAEDEPEEPLPAKVALYRSEREEDPLESEAKAIAAHCRENVDAVTGMIEWAVPILIMAAKHAVTSVAEAGRYVQLYLIWKHGVLRLWHPDQPWLASMKLEAQRAMVDRVEKTPEFRAVRRLLDRERKATPEYKESQREYRRKPEVMKANRDASKLRMVKYRAKKKALDVA